MPSGESTAPSHLTTGSPRFFFSPGSISSPRRSSGSSIRGLPDNVQQRIPGPASRHRQILKTIWILPVVVLASLSSCKTPQTDAAPLPQKMEISCGGILGESFAVKLDGRHVEYTRSTAFFGPARIRPTDAAWAAFWKEMGAVALWEWKPDYRPPPNIIIEDGTQWRVSITHAGRSIDSRGENAYPSDADPKIPVLEGVISTASSVSRPPSRGLSVATFIKPPHGAFATCAHPSSLPAEEFDQGSRSSNQTSQTQMKIRI